MKKSAWINMTDKKLHDQLEEQTKRAEIKDFKQFISSEQEKEVKSILSKIL
jgi:hypothetical protein